MASTYTPLIRTENPTPGEQTNAWGTTENNGRTLMEQAIAGMLTKDVSAGGTITLTANQGSADESRKAILYLTGTLPSNTTIVVPSSTKIYLVTNATNGAYTLTLNTSVPGTGAVINQNATVLVYCDGTNVVQVGAQADAGTVLLTQVFS